MLQHILVLNKCYVHKKSFKKLMHHFLGVHSHIHYIKSEQTWIKATKLTFSILSYTTHTVHSGLEFHSKVV